PTPESNTPTGASGRAMTRSAATAVRVPPDTQLAETCLHGIDQQQPAHQRATEADQQFHRLEGLNTADDTHQRPDDPRLGAAQGLVIALAIAVQALVARALRIAQVEYAHLPLQAYRRPRHQRFAQRDAGSLQRLPGSEVVGAVEDQVGLGDGLVQLLTEQP